MVCYLPQLQLLWYVCNKCWLWDSAKCVPSKSFVTYNKFQCIWIKGCLYLPLKEFIMLKQLYHLRWGNCMPKCSDPFSSAHWKQCRKLGSEDCYVKYYFLKYVVFTSLASLFVFPFFLFFFGFANRISENIRNKHWRTRRQPSCDNCNVSEEAYRWDFCWCFIPVYH